MSYVDLKNKEKLLPLYILKNFKKYILPKINIITDEDPCINISKDLTLYQNFIGDYLKHDSPFKELLLYHGKSSGKTITSLNVYNILYNYSDNWNLIILIPKLLYEDPWLKDIDSWVFNNNKKNKINNIKFVYYDSPNADIEFLQIINNITNSKNIFIIDEVHKFISYIYNKNKMLKIIYEYIVNEKKKIKILD